MVTRAAAVVAGFGIITVSRWHSILVFRSPGELADLEHVRAEPFDLCEHAV